jgi:hypothetical protein
MRFVLDNSVTMHCLFASLRSALTTTGGQLA